MVTDIPAIIALLADDPLGQHREDVKSPPNPRYAAAFQAIEAAPNQLLTIVTVGEEVIGTMQITFMPGPGRMGAWRGQIEAVRIAVAYRNAGLGQQMFERAIAECRTRCCNLVQLTTTRHAPTPIDSTSVLALSTVALATSWRCGRTSQSTTWA